MLAALVAAPAHAAVPIAAWHTTGPGGTGTLVITDRAGHSVAVPLAPATADDASGPQADFTAIKLAPDRLTLGWLAEYNACAQSYPCPISLVLFSGGHVVRRFAPAYGIIWGWCFLAGGSEVAIQSGYAHGDSTGEAQLFNAATGQKIADYTTGPQPAWVATLNSASP